MDAHTPSATSRLCRSSLAVLALAALLAPGCGVEPMPSAAPPVYADADADARVAPEVLAALQHGEARDVLVELTEGVLPGGAVLTQEAAWDEAKRAVLAAMPEDGVRPKRGYTHLPVMHVRVASLAGLRALLARPEVARVHDDERLVAFDNLALIRQPEAAAGGRDGAGASVAVLDTGVDYGRAAFGACTSPGQPAGCRVAYAADFAPDDGALDAHGHGTNVAGIVRAVAPGASVLALDVFDGEYAYASAVIAAIDWSIANRAAYNIASLNLSLGSGGYRAPCARSVYATAVARARAAGIVTVAASGNGGYADALSSPACAPGVVSVGAVYHETGGAVTYSVCRDATSETDRVTCFSNGASFLTLLAPGARISAAGLTMWGTSQAAPHVAGAVAVLRAAFPAEGPDLLVERMTRTGATVTDARNGVATPRLDLAAAVAAGAPRVDAVSVDGGAEYTRSRMVSVALAARDPGAVAEMCVTHAANCTAWVPYATSVALTLPEDSARYTVRAWFRDARGEVLGSPAEDAIVYDVVPPTDGDVSATPGPDHVALSWRGYADELSDVARYRVVAGDAPPASCAEGTEVYDGASGSVLHAGLAVGAQRYYRVCATDRAGNTSAGRVVRVGIAN